MNTVLAPQLISRPILMSGPMVRALLAGTKTQTRRIVKPQPEVCGADWLAKRRDGCAQFLYYWPRGEGHAVNDRFVSESCPYGQPGDRLWVRESIRFDPAFTDDGTVRYLDGASKTLGPLSGDVPDAGLVTYFRLLDKAKKAGKSISVPSIHMPRWASRITLEITGARAERLQAIDHDDAEAEGIEAEREPTGGDDFHTLYRDYMAKPGAEFPWFKDSVRSYRSLWDSINGKHQSRPGVTSLAHSWFANPWVWVVEFKRVDE